MVEWPEDQLFTFGRVEAFSKSEGAQKLSGSSNAEGSMDSLENLATMMPGLSLSSSDGLPPITNTSWPASPLPIQSFADSQPITPTQPPSPATPLGHVPQTPIPNHAIASPSPSPPRQHEQSQQTTVADSKKESNLVRDPDYVKGVAALIQIINKTHVEWAKKSNELNLTLTRTRANKNTAGSELEKKLANEVKNGDTANQQLRVVEEKYVLQKVITQAEQSEVKNVIARIGKASKNGSKIKHS